MPKQPFSAVTMLLCALIVVSGFFAPAGEVLATNPFEVPAANPFANPDDITTIGGLLNWVNTLLNAVIPFLVGLAVLVIIYGVFGYIRHAAEEEKRGEARMFVLWGVIGVFAMVSIWGFISILVNTLPLKRSAPEVKSVFPVGEIKNPNKNKENACVNNPADPWCTGS